MASFAPEPEGVGGDRALYLAEADGLTLRVEGRTLRIDQPGRPPVYVPPDRLARAVFWGSVLVDAEAIGLLLDRNVPVSFVGRGGQTRGLAWGPGRGSGDLGALVDQRRRDPAWAEAYRTLLDAQVREARLDLARREDPKAFARWQAQGLRTADWEAWRRQLFPAQVPEAALDAAWRYLKSLLWHAVAGWSLDAGLDPHRGVLDARQTFGLVRELARPLAPWIDGTVAWGARAGLVRRGGVGDALTPAAVRRWTARFEGHQGWLAADVSARIDALASLARDWQPPTPRRARRQDG